MSDIQPIDEEALLRELATEKAQEVDQVKITPAQLIPLVNVQRAEPLPLLIPKTKRMKARKYILLIIGIFLVSGLGYGIWSYVTNGYVSIGMTSLGGIFAPVPISLSITIENVPTSLMYPSTGWTMSNSAFFGFTLKTTLPKQSSSIAIFPYKLITTDDEFNNEIMSTKNAKNGVVVDSTITPRNDSIKALVTYDASSSDFPGHSAILFNGSQAMYVDSFGTSKEWPDIKPTFDMIVGSIKF
jgi:hypothetical protein